LAVAGSRRRFSESADVSSASGRIHAARFSWSMGRKEGRMHIVMLSLMVALAVCVLLLVAFALFTLTPFARRIQQNEQRHRPRFS
jgi:hypothetical protein